LNLGSFPTGRSRQADRNRASLSQGARDWIDGVLADPDYSSVLQMLRNSLIHRGPTRAIPSIRMLFVLTAPTHPSQHVDVPVRDLLLKARDCAGRHVIAFLSAASTGTFYPSA
jgi:hypothetical protein